MKILKIIKVAFKNITNNKLRSILTMIGLIIGIASVIILVGISDGSNKDVASQVQSLGADVLTISINSQDANLEYTDMKDITELINVSSASPYKNVQATVSRSTITSNSASVTATDHNYLDIRNLTLSEGRTISIIDIENKSKVCIIGYTLQFTLFNLSNPIGQTIKLNGDDYTVIGTLKEQGTSMGQNSDNAVLIPISTAKYLGSNASINNVYVKVENKDNINISKTMLENYLMSKLEITSDYYSVSTQTSMLNAMNSISGTLTLLLVGVASISLVVGGIGVMNVMLVSVTERTKEIGIRKSLGAKKTDILFQFLIEALVLSILGGLIGIGAGMLLGNLSSILGYSFIASRTATTMSFTSSAAIGLVFGIFPAYRAACLNPIEALRQE